MKYSELLRTYIKNSGLSLSAISDLLKEEGFSISKGYISMLQNGKTDPGSEELNRALAKVTGGSVDDLMMAALMEKAPHEIKEKLLRLERLKNLRSELKDTIIVKDPSIEYVSENLIKVPLLGSIAAGQPIDRIEYIEDIEYVHKGVLRGREAFALHVRGDSMTGDNIMPEDIVICVKQQEVTQNDIAVVIVNEESATIKRVQTRGEFCILIPSNPKLQPQIVSSSNVEIIGKVVEVRRRF